MTVIELAVLHALPDGNGKVPSERLLANLRNAKQVLESSSGYSFNFLQQLEDPFVTYIVGAWSSPAAHEVFLPSIPNFVSSRLIQRAS